MINVAIVEDADEFRNLWREILNYTEGFTCVATFDNAPDAVAGLPDVAADVVLMDINLPPDGNGIDCVRQLRGLCPTTQFLMFTIFQDDTSLFEALKAGATGYILKKTSPAKVLEAITELHEGGSPMSSAIARRVIQFFHNQVNESETWGLIALEKAILELLSKGLQYKEIAAEMTISLPMIKHHLHIIYKKMHVGNSREAMIKYLAHLRK